MYKNHHTRREFLSSSLAGIASLGLVNCGKEKENFAKKIDALKSESKKVITRTLGKTNIAIPVISMGMLNIDETELIQRSYEIGMRHFDTSSTLESGKTEEMVGTIIKKLGIRDKIIIATKAYIKNKRQITPEQLKDAFLEIFEGSLKRLQMDYVDILYFSDVETAEEVRNPGILEAMSSLKKQNKIKFSGVSTHSGMTKVLNETAESGFYDVVLTSINFTMADDLDLLNAIKNASEKGIGIIAMKTQAGGKHKSQTALLKWVLRNKYITTAIPSYTNHDHMLEDWSVAYDLEYTEEEKEFLQNQNINIGMNFCRQCKNCLATCPKGIDIPSLMRIHMYASQYANFEHARFTFDNIPKENGLENCNLCSDCTARCIRDIRIAKNIQDLKMMYC